MPSSFVSPLIVKVLDKHKFELFRPFTYHLDSKYSKAKIVVPKGFVTDFASIPKMFWSILPSYGRYTKSAVLHDFLYAVDNGYTRKEADQIFLEAMKVLNVPLLTRNTMYNAVRWFGGAAWKKHRQ